MATKILVIIAFVLSIQCKQIYGEEHANDELGNFAELAAELFQSQGAQGLGSLVQGIMGSAISGALSGGEGGGDERSGSNLGQVLRGLGNMVGPNARGIDTNVISGIFGMLGSSLDSGKKSEGGVDVMSVLSTVGGVLSQPGNAERLEKLTGYMPLVMDFMNAVYGPEAQERERRHAGHSWLFPPIFERLHIFADHFLSSEFGRKMMNNLGAEKVVKIFSDDTGRFSYDKFVELMENHSFRRHWIHLLTLRLGKLIEHYSNPKIYEQYVNMAQFMINAYLSQQGYPKSVLLNPEAPVDSLSALANFFTDKYLGTQVDAKYYIQPVFSYATQLLDMVSQESKSRGGTEGISARLADSINLEIIEPIARVNRAYRYLKKNPICDRYVLCLVNQRGPESDALPGLKLLLSRGTSFVASWALSTLSGQSMLEYFTIIMYEDQCQKHFKPDCSDYHDEEYKVTTEYIHNEL